MQSQYITLKGRALDLTNRRFGRLVALGPIGRNANGDIRWHCRCDCGNATFVAATHLIHNHTTSCGCYQAEVTTKRSTSHGMSHTKEYEAWCSMNKRCYSPNNKEYQNYGGRGIAVCDEWRYDFVAFYDHIGPMPFPKATIDRINNELSYFPGNVKWSTQKEQARNRRNNTLLTHNGKTQSMSAWVEETGISRGAIQTRIKMGWPIDKVLTEPADNESAMITYDGRTQHIAAWAKEVGLHRAVIRSRLQLGWPIDKVLTEPVRKR